MSFEKTLVISALDMNLSRKAEALVQGGLE